MLRQFLLIILMVAATPLAAQDTSRMTFGGDVYAAGRTASVGEAVEGDLFAAGNRVEVEGEVTGSAHLAGRLVSVDEAIGGNLYAAGMDVEVNAPVAGGVTAMGNSVTLSDTIEGNIRAMGGDVMLGGTVAGSAILGGESIEVNGEIAGDLSIAGANVDWGEAASVAGTVIFYAEDEEDVNVPERVAPADRVEFRSVEGWEEDIEAATEQATPGFWAKLTGLFGGVILTTLVATLVAALAPGFTATLRERALASPLRSLWMGALGLAVAAGSTVVLAMTGIGIFLAPLSIAFAVALGFAGYVTGAYLLGVWAVNLAGQGLPDSTLDRAIAAFVGAALLALVMLIPFIGWLAVFAVLLIGIGGLVIRVFSPVFFEEPA